MGNIIAPRPRIRPDNSSHPGSDFQNPDFHSPNHDTPTTIPVKIGTISKKLGKSVDAGAIKEHSAIEATTAPHALAPGC
jgi:hypothetical protein